MLKLKDNVIEVMQHGSGTLEMYKKDNRKYEGKWGRRV